jgi:hypothetical protein
VRGHWQPQPGSGKGGIRQVGESERKRAAGTSRSRVLECGKTGRGVRGRRKRERVPDAESAAQGWKPHSAQACFI